MGGQDISGSDFACLSKGTLYCSSNVCGLMRGDKIFQVLILRVLVRGHYIAVTMYVF